ncbi:fatty acyl-CoA reductase wat-like, partial [Ceratina calcarata]|uniref:Fatty acyl-CoA reductase n=1 Tax=Ceratina calcarata TaxID=156304 RepID=A0AAJ7WD89_9HYME
MVYFEAKVSLILRTNVLSTQKMLELAAECPNLNAFVYVSTAYSHHYMNPIEEKFYTPPGDLKMVEDIIRADEENAAGLSKEALNDIIGKWLNQYAFSKAIAEGTDTRNGPVVFLTLFSLGLLHVVPMGPYILSDYVPVDMATNGLLSVIWDYVVHRETNEPQVYNYASSDWHPLSLSGYENDLINSIRKYPSVKMVWYPFMIYISNSYLFLIFHLMFHVFPAIIADLFLLSQRKKPKAVNIIFKLTKQIKVLNYFMNTSWVIKSDKVKSIVSRMNATDLDEFLFDLNLLDWSFVTDAVVLYTRKAVKDPMETIPYAQKRLEKLKILHYSTITLIP